MSVKDQVATMEYGIGSSFGVKTEGMKVVMKDGTVHLISADWTSKTGGKVNALKDLENGELDFLVDPEYIADMEEVTAQDLKDFSAEFPSLTLIYTANKH